MYPEIESEVLRKVKPDREEISEVNQAAEELKEKMETISKGRYRPLLVGSVPKKTFLKKPDIDIFILFPESSSLEDLEKIGLRVGRHVLDETEEKYAEHPYVHGKFKGYRVDIVPCFDVKDIDEMKSSVDRTPLHTEYMINNLDEEQRDEVILLKAFLKGIGAYSAENRVQGFSGYLCELLILKYGDFNSLLKAAGDWKKGEIIEVEQIQSTFDAPLIVVDPVDPKRNVASALSEYNFDLFVFASKSYSKKPDIKFFFPNPIDVLDVGELNDKIDSRGTSFLDILILRPDIVEDNLYPQVQKAHKALRRYMARKNFSIIHDDYMVNDNSIHLLFELEHACLPSIKKHQGPPIGNPHTSAFEKKYSERVYIEDGRLMVDKKRLVRTAKQAIRKAVKKLDLGSDLNDYFLDDLMIVEDGDIAEKYPAVLSKFMDKRPPWKR